MKEAPLVLWMSGGPGCSSLLAAMMENGPCRVSRDEEGRARALPNDFGWNGEANVVWVDQPSGVGFSYDASGKEEEDMMFSHDQVADNMLAFLHRWQERFPDSHNGEFYIFAESFGGHYAPAVGRRYFDAEKAGVAPEGLKLKGIGVGNGLTNPKVQYKYTAKFAYENTYGIQAISEEEYKNVTENYLPTCELKIKDCNDAEDFSVTSCSDAFMYCNSYLYSGYVQSGRNIYDVRKFGNFDDDMHAVTEFVTQDRVREALDALVPTTFEACNMDVYMKFLFDWMKEYDKALPAMLDEGINILIYAGDADFICNWMGNLAWVEDMEWAGKEAFNKAKEENFVLDDGKAYGAGKSAKVGKGGGTLTFLRIFGASHMAPRDQPEATREMLNRFMQRNGEVIV
ncbi:hypothetical protein TrRE_jg77 [Triparma retinervis]|uniref:Carboxypeptidase n=1 Tax=Triparma retinervis TaxID=2557542 RepID=A0A9W7G2N2_9STRA|nr:hypothetical protein TrRE_jg77 [Triparma retinervis]